MAEGERLLGERSWFVDVRSSARRLAVTTHAEAGVVVLSLWQGDRCTGSFRLPLDDAPALVAALTEGMTAVDPPPSPALRRIK